MPGTTESTMTIDIEEVMTHVTMTVDLRLSPPYRVRTWLAKKLLYLVAGLLGCGIEFEQ